MVSYLHVWEKAKLLQVTLNLTNLANIQHLHENGKWIKCVLTEYILYWKMFLLFHTALLKCFILQPIYGILYSSWCNNSCRTYHELRQGDFYSFDLEKVPFYSNYLLPTQKKNQPQEKSSLSNWFTIIRMLSDETISSILSVTVWTSIGLWNVWFLLVNISSKLSTINKYFKIVIFFIDEN